MCDRSFGIHVAELAHFPSRVVEVSVCSDMWSVLMECLGQFARQKAAELEVFHSTSRVLDEEPSAKRRCVEGEDDEAKRRREQVREGEKLIGEFLSKVGSLPLETLSEEEVRGRLEGLREEVLRRNNPYIQAILDSCQSSMQ